MLRIMNVSTRQKVEFREITGDVQNAVMSSGIRSGICYVFIPHTTAGVTLNEHADPDVITDLTERLGKLAPEGEKYHHAEGNSPGHVKTSVVGSSTTLIIEGGQVLLGTWQGVFLAEFDGPRDRTVYLKIMSG